MGNKSRDFKCIFASVVSIYFKVVIKQIKFLQKYNKGNLSHVQFGQQKFENNGNVDGFIIKRFEWNLQWGGELIRERAQLNKYRIMRAWRRDRKSFM